MKNGINVLWVIVMAALIAFTFTGCPDTSDEYNNNDNEKGDETTGTSTQGSGAYTVTFDANGATGGSVPAAQTVTANTAISLPNVTGLSKEGYVFCGWNTKSDGTGTDYWHQMSTTYQVTGSASYSVKENSTLYATWFVLTGNTYTGTASRSFTFNDDGVCIVSVAGTASGTYSYTLSDYTITTSVGYNFHILSPTLLSCAGVLYYMQ